MSDYSRDLFRQYEETMNRLSMLEKQLQISESKHREEIRELNRKHACEVAALKKEIAEKDRIIETQSQKIEQLEDEIVRLKSHMNNNSGNSSNPPSRDQKKSRKAANEYNHRVKSAQKQGAQEGHPGTTLTKEYVETLIREKKCEHEVLEIGKAQTNGKYISKYILDEKIVTVVKELRYYADQQGNTHIPKSFSGDVIYGSTIKAMIVFLYSEGAMSNDRIGTFIRSISNGLIQISEGTIYNACRDFSQLAQKSLCAIETNLQNSLHLYTDATVSSIDGVQSYIRNLSTAREVRYYSMKKKTIAALEEIQILKTYVGTLIHDHETALYRFGTKHAECNVHLSRYLKKNTEETHHKWSVELEKLLNRGNSMRKEYLEKGKNELPEEEIVGIETEYDCILEKGRAENKEKMSKSIYEDEKSLLNRLKKYKENHLLFLHDSTIEYSNNMSESDLRKVKIRQKMSGGFRKYEGSQMYCDILSIVETCKRRGLGIYETICKFYDEKDYVLL